MSRSSNVLPYIVLNFNLKSRKVLKQNLPKYVTCNNKINKPERNLNLPKH